MFFIAELKHPTNRAVLELVFGSAFRTNGPALGIEFQTMSKFGHPAHLARGVPNQQRIIRYVLGHHRARTDEGVFPDVVPANDGCIRPDGGPLPYSGSRILIPTIDRAARIDHIGEHTRWTKKNVVIAGYSGVQRHIVLNLDVVAELNTGRDHYILTDVASFAQHRTGHDV